jgi:N-acetylmuramoyl-L-alanine amidase CwlA
MLTLIYSLSFKWLFLIIESGHKCQYLAPCSGLIVNIPSSMNCYGSNGRAAKSFYLPVQNQAIFAEFRNIFLLKNLRHTKVKGKSCVKRYSKEKLTEFLFFKATIIARFKKKTNKKKTFFRYTLVNFVTKLHTHFVKHFKAILLHKRKSGILFD